MVTGLKLLLATCVLCLAPVAAAESLPDPTRPPIDLGAATGGAAEAAPAAAAPRGLQSTIISPHYRAAIINGETVRLGGKSGDSRLIEVREGSVVLQSAQGRRVMELFPGVRIKQIETAPRESGAAEQDVGGAK